MKSVHKYVHNELKAFFALCIYICIMCWQAIWEKNVKAVKGLSSKIKQTRPTVNYAHVNKRGFVSASSVRTKSKVVKKLIQSPPGKSNKTSKATQKEIKQVMELLRGGHDVSKYFESNVKNQDGDVNCNPVRSDTSHVTANEDNDSSVECEHDDDIQQVIMPNS